MSSSNDEKAERRREQKRDWARREAQKRRDAGGVSYTTEWRENNPEAYEAQKEAVKARRKLTKEA